MPRCATGSWPRRAATRSTCTSSRASAGNPAVLPPTLVAAVQLEVSALPPASRSLLEGAAVAGDPFDPELAAAAADLGDDALVLLDKLAAADLVRPTGSARGFAFRHPIVRRAVYDAAPAGWRIGAHERAAAALEERGAAPLAIAHHVEQSARPGDLAAVALLEAAGVASQKTSPAGAARWFAAALELLPADASKRRLELLAPMAQALAAAGRLNEAVPAFDAALDADAAGSDPRAARTGDRLRARHADARPLDGGAPPPRGRACRRRAGWRPDRPRQPRAAHRHLGRVLRRGRRGGRRARPERRSAGGVRRARPRSRGEGLRALAAMWGGRPDEAAEAIASASAGFDALTDDELARWPDTAYWHGTAELLLEFPLRTLKTTLRGIEVARATGHDRSVIPLAGLRAMTLALVGRHDRGNRDARRDRRGVPSPRARRSTRGGPVAARGLRRDARRPDRGRPVRTRVGAAARLARAGRVEHRHAERPAQPGDALPVHRPRGVHPADARRRPRPRRPHLVDLPDGPARDRRAGLRAPGRGLGVGRADRVRRRRATDWSPARRGRRWRALRS